MIPMINNKDGFTLLEILITLAISGIVMTGIYTVYTSQQITYNSQMQIVEMQQNLRAGMLMVVNEIRMAGYDPTDDSNAGIVNFESDTITFTMDLDSDGATTSSGENLTYLLYTASDGKKKLGRKNPTISQAVAENIDALNFVYLDENGNVTATASEVRSIQISMVARTNRVAVSEHLNTKTYYNLQGDAIYTAGGDTYRRRLSATQIKFRNLGL
jgi:type IV pilus assembly protein PilW